MANLNIEQPSSVEEILETGVLDNWYLVARDTDVDSKPVGLTRLSRDIVLWRDGDGALHCVEDFSDGPRLDDERKDLDFSATEGT